MQGQEKKIQLINLISWDSQIIDNSDSNKKIATLATKAVLKANLNKIVKFQVFDSICFRSKSNFKDDDIQDYLVFQLVLRYFKKSFNRNYISGWKSKRLYNGSTKPPAVSNQSFAPALNCINTK